MFHIENSKSNITINQLNFYNGVVLNHVLNIIFAESLFISNSNCTVSNSTNNNRSHIYKSTGGCFRTQNILHREFHYVNIFNSFSDKTTYGIKIIDDLASLYLLKSSILIPTV